MEYAIREATMQDYEALLPIFHEVNEHHRRALPHIFCRPDGPIRSRDYMHGLFADDDSAIFVAECDQGIVGEVKIALRESRDIPILVPRRYAVVDTLVVLEAYRRAGIGQALMERAHDWARARGVTQVDLTVWEFNAGAMAFYERLGYAVARRTMSMSLERQD